MAGVEPQQLFGILACLGGAGGLGYAAHLWRLSRRAAGWPVAPGRVTDCRVVRKASRMPGRGSVWTARVAYEYEVDGQTLRGRTLDIAGDLLAGRARAAAFCREHPPGSRVQVRHDPNDPTRCCLRHSPAVPLLTAAASVLILLVGATFLAG
jgi:hypothetical protein